jgi:DNA repair protein RecO (recombination protein O)
MLHQTRGIVFHLVKYSETSLIAKIYTELFGLQSYILKGVRSHKSKVKPNLLQHLGLVDMIVYHKASASIQNIREIRHAYQFTSIPFDIRKTSVAIFLNEVLYKSIREEQPDRPLFDFIYQAVVSLDQAGDNIASFSPAFLVHLSRHLGFAPGGECSEQRPCFDPSGGVFISADKAIPGCFSRDESRALSLLAAAPFDQAVCLPIAPAVREELLDRLLTYYRIHLAAFPQVKSHQVLRTIFE